MKITLARLGIAALIVGSLAACGGGGGGGGGAVPPAGGSSSATLPPPLPGAATTVDYSNGAAQFPVMTPVITVGGASVNSAPVIAFSLGDGNGNPYAGFDKITTKTATATVASYPNFAFSIAKLVPGTNGSPSKWVSYIVTTVPSTTTAAAPTRPSTDNTGKLEYLGQGIYQYTFYRDITKTNDVVAAMTVAAPKNKADLGDLRFDSNALHRVTIQFAGNAPGTSTNTPTGANSGIAAVPLKNPLNVIYDFIPATGKAVLPTDAVAQRLIVDRLSCNECHGKLGGIPGTESQSFHSGSRYDPKYCVVCHTDQRKYDRNNPTDSQVSTNFAFPVGSNTYIADGVTVGDFPVLIHRVHKGELLIKQNYNFGGVLLNETRFPQDIRNCTKCHDNTAPKVAPQANNFQTVPSRLACGACHDGIDFATGTGITNNGKNSGHLGGPRSDDSQCKLCHDEPTVKTVYHVAVTPPSPDNILVGGGTNNNSNAAWLAANRNNLPSGAIKVTYEIQSVSRDAVTGNPKIVFRMLQNGARKDFNNPTASAEIWDSFFGSPSIYFVWAVTQDGITAPSDFNASASAYIRSLWNGVYPNRVSNASTANPPGVPVQFTAASASSMGTLTAPDTNGFYTATLTGVNIPATAVMLTGGIGYSYGLQTTPPLTQIGVLPPCATGTLCEPLQSNITFNTPRYGVLPSTVAFPTVLWNGTNPAPNGDSTLTGPCAPPATCPGLGMPNKTGGLVVIAPDAQKVATGYTGRRAIVEDARCNNCHLELGVFTTESFHGGQRNDGSTCAWCHNPARTSSGWSADSTYFIHAIHAGDKRTNKFSWHASEVGKSFADIGYPGILSKCETCHLPGTYDFSASASAAALPNKQYRTVATGIFNSGVGVVTSGCTVSNITPISDCKQTALGAYSLSPYVTADNAANYGSAGTGTNLVISPVATVCFSCHDSAIARSHMESNGGSIYLARSVALTRVESCMVCHGTGSIADIKVMHAK